MKGTSYSENFWFSSSDDVEGFTLSFEDKKTYDSWVKIQKKIHWVPQIKKVTN